MNTISNTQKLTSEEIADLYALPEATLPELVVLAQKCGLQSKIQYNSDGTGNVFLVDLLKVWDPATILEQNQLLLAAVIADGDCRLFYDQELNEYFIYAYRYNDSDDGPPLAHRATLPDTVFEAAINLWFPYEE